MYCTDCGLEVLATAKFCTGCGVRQGPDSSYEDTAHSGSGLTVEFIKSDAFKAVIGVKYKYYRSRFLIMTEMRLNGDALNKLPFI